MLISKDDPLSPQWVRFITPGKDYIGTQELFSEEATACMQIPGSEIVDDFDNQNLTDSFFKALRTYLLTAAQAVLRDRDCWGSKNITMMVHPHRETKYQDAWGKSITNTEGLGAINSNRITLKRIKMLSIRIIQVCYFLLKNIICRLIILNNCTNWFLI